MALNTDKLRKKKSLFSTTLSSSITDSDVTIPLSSASGLPTDTAITLTIDRVDANGVSTPAKVERITGVISGNNLTVALRAQDDTSAAAHDSGAVVEDIWDADTWNDSVDGVLAEHNQDGTHDTTKVVDLATAQTLTNKTLTNPTINFTDKNITMNVKCAVYLGIEQLNILDNTHTKILFDTEVYDTGSDFDTTNKRFTAPVTGYYLVNLGISWSSPVADTYYSCAVYVNGTRVDRTWSFFHASAINFLTSNVSAVVYVAAGQYIEGYAYHAGGADTPDLRSERTSMDITLISI